MVVPGGVWKCTELVVVEGRGGGQEESWGLLGEAVAPGFDYHDMTIGDEDLMGKEDLPGHLWHDVILPYLKPKS